LGDGIYKLNTHIMEAEDQNSLLDILEREGFYKKDFSRTEDPINKHLRFKHKASKLKFEIHTNPNHLHLFQWEAQQYHKHGEPGSINLNWDKTAMNSNLQAVQQAWTNWLKDDITRFNKNASAINRWTVDDVDDPDNALGALKYDISLFSPEEITKETKIWTDVENKLLARFNLQEQAINEIKSDFQFLRDELKTTKKKTWRALAIDTLQKVAVTITAQAIVAVGEKAVAVTHSTVVNLMLHLIMEAYKAYSSTS
jgi:hypothetical protein